MCLTHQANVKNPSPRIARMISKLGEFTFKIKHTRGKESYLTDYLSRKDEEDESCELKYGKLMYNKGKKAQIVTRGQFKKKEEKDSEVKFMEKQTKENQKKKQDEINEDAVKEKQRKDHFWKSMIGYIQTGKLENCTRHEKGQIMQLAPNFYIDKGQMRYSIKDRQMQNTSKLYRLFRRN